MTTFSMSTLQAALPRCAHRAAAASRPSQRLAVRAAPAYQGLARDNRLCMGTAPVDGILSAASNGSRWFAMRHGNKLSKLNRPADQRKAMMRTLTTEVLNHGKITTTKTKAKVLRKYVDKMITLAKDGSLHARRQVLAFVYNKKIVARLFDEAPARYADRNGGFCRVVSVVPDKDGIRRYRRGDNVEMAVIELLTVAFAQTQPPTCPHCAAPNTYPR